MLKHQLGLLDAVAAALAAAAIGAALGYEAGVTQPGRIVLDPARFECTDRPAAWARRPGDCTQYTRRKH